MTSVVVIGTDVLTYSFVLAFCETFFLAVAVAVRNTIFELAPPSDRYRYYLRAGFINGLLVQIVAGLWIWIVGFRHPYASPASALIVATTVVTTIIAGRIWPAQQRP